MLTWSKLPFDAPVNGDTVYIRVNFYYSDPFLATYNSSTNEFTSIENSIVYPAWVVARWASTLGAELIVNGSFSGSSPWYASAPWSIVTGKAQFDATATNVIGQPLTITAGKRYLLSFDILDLTLTSRSRFVSSSFTALFYGEWGTLTSHAAGHYAVTVTAAVDSTYIFFEGQMSDPTFSWANVSLREIIS